MMGIDGNCEVWIVGAYMVWLFEDSFWSRVLEVQLYGFF